MRHARLALPRRVNAALEVESGLNDPMPVFLTVLLYSTSPAGARRHSLRRRDGRRRPFGFCGSLYDGWRSRPRSTPCWRFWVHRCCLGLRRVLERPGSSPSIWQTSRSAPASADGPDEEILPIPARRPALSRWRKTRRLRLFVPDDACQPGKSLPRLLKRLGKSIVFHVLERICSCGRKRQNRVIVFPVEPINRSEHRGEREAENRLHRSGARA